MVSCLTGKVEPTELPAYEIEGISAVDSSLWVIARFFYSLKMATLAAGVVITLFLWFGNFEVQGLMRDTKVTDSYDRLNRILLLLKTEEYGKGTIPSDNRTNEFKRIINGIEASQ
jgi:hypothetical protein